MNESDYEDILNYDVIPALESAAQGIWLSESDKVELVEHSSKLFDTYQGDARDAMSGLAAIFNMYRFELHWYNKHMEIKNSRALSKKSDDEKADKLKGHMQAILAIIGETELPLDDYRTDADELKKYLKRALNKTEQMLPAKPEYIIDGEHKPKPHTDMVKNYLTKLQLPLKSKQIESFIKAL